MSKFTFRMSSSGYCARRLSAALVGISRSKAPPWLESAAEEGNWHETRIKAELKSLGCEITDEQLEVTMPFSGFDLVGHCDGRVHVSGELLDAPNWHVYFIDMKRSDVDFSQRMLLECKSFSFLEHQRWEQGRFDAFPQYACQLTCYGRAMSCPLAAYVVKDRSSGTRSLYIAKSGQASLPAIIEKLSLVSTYASKGQLVPIEFDSQSVECRRCEYRVELCAPNVRDVVDSELEEAAYNYLVGREQEREGKRVAEEARDLLIAYANQKKLERWRVGQYEVYYSSYPREDISIKRLQAFMPREAFEPAISVSQVERIRVVDKESEND